LDQLEPDVEILGQHVAVAAGQDDRQAGGPFAHDIGKIHAVHPWHDHVGENQVGGKFVGLKQRQGRSCVGDASDAITEVFQQLGREASDIVVVLNDENRVAAAS